MITVDDISKLRNVCGRANEDHENICDDCGEPYLVDNGCDNSKLCHQCAQIIAQTAVPRLLDEIERLQACLCGVAPEDVVKFVEAIRNVIRETQFLSDGYSLVVYTQLRDAFACLPENKEQTRD